MNSTNTQVNPLELNVLLRAEAVLNARGLKKSQHYLDVQTGLYTPPVKLGGKAVAWPLSEVAALNAARIAGKSNDEIRALVQRLVAARAELGVAQ